MTKCLLDVLSSLDFSHTLSSRLDYLNTCTEFHLDGLKLTYTEVWIPLSASCNIILPGNPHFSKRHLQLPTCSGEKSRGHPWILFSLTFHSNLSEYYVIFTIKIIIWFYPSHHVPYIQNTIFFCWHYYYNLLSYLPLSNSLSGC